MAKTNLGTCPPRWLESDPRSPWNTNPNAYRYRNKGTLKYNDLIERLIPYFSFPRTEIIRMMNCMFHEILACIRDGFDVDVPYFGTFHGQTFIGRRLYLIEHGIKAKRAQLIMRVKPILYPNNYAMHVCSPRAAFSTPCTYLSKHMQSTPGSLYYWYKNNFRYKKRSLMLYDNPYPTIHTKGLEYVLKESHGIHFPSETEEVEWKWLNSLFRDHFYQKDKKPINRFVIKVLRKNKDTGERYFETYNYLAANQYVGGDTCIYMNMGEAASGLTKYDVFRWRHKAMEETFRNIEHLPEHVPDSITYTMQDYYNDTPQVQVQASQERYLRELNRRLNALYNKLDYGIGKITGMKKKRGRPRKTDTQAKPLPLHKNPKFDMPSEYYQDSDKTWLNVETNRRKFELILGDKKFGSLMQLRDYFDEYGRNFTNCDIERIIDAENKEKESSSDKEV